MIETLLGVLLICGAFILGTLARAFVDGIRQGRKDSR